MEDYIKHHVEVGNTANKGAFDKFTADLGAKSLLPGMVYERDGKALYDTHYPDAERFVFL